ncbi:MAG: pyruvate formate lyase family protein [Dehalococcoidia bacterium]|nr:pyruvate formate lyase family protein [Dehalococcoidia bacterium]
MIYQLDVQAKLSDRVKRLKESFHEAPVKLSTERLRFVLEAYRETEGRAPIIRRAMVLDKYLKGMTLQIDENPIVGNPTQYRRGVNPYPEWAANWFTKKDHNSQFGSLQPKLNDEDWTLIREARTYFNGRCMVDKVNEVFADMHPGLTRPEIVRECSILDSAFVPIGYIVVDNARVINRGLEGLLEDVRQRLERIPAAYVQEIHRIEFLKAARISLEAVIAWANRYADLAEQMAQSETDESRKKELIGIAERCRRVPAKPARDFRDAVQSLWFTHAAMWAEVAQIGMSPGRIGQYLNPFPLKDKQEGKITDEEAVELIELFFIKMSELALHQPGDNAALAAPNHLGQNISIGGVKIDGTDATTELDYLILEADAQVRMIQPSLVCIWHNRLPEELLMKCAENIRLGIGKPAFVNSDLCVQRNMDRYKCSVEEARDFAIVACTQSGIVGKINGDWETLISLPKMLELALNNGVNPLTGVQHSLKTGDPTKFQTYEELHEAVWRHLEYLGRLGREMDIASLSLNSQYLPSPFCSCLVDDCIEKGMNLLEGGSRYSFDTQLPVGTVDLANSLAAIKKLVFEDKKLTMKQVIDALKADFKGYDTIRKMMIDAPKYGNDDDYVDQITKDWFDLFYKMAIIYKSHVNTDDGRPEAVSVSLHRLFGHYCGALPNGRKSLQPFADGITSAYPGTDKNGPTALIKSAAKVLDPMKYDGNLLNMKLHPTAVADRQGMRKLLMLVKTLMDLGGYHVQFNVVDSETLRDAQQHPEEYKNLIVRVAGYSAFFVQLDPLIQEEIIDRTEQRI